MIKTFPFRVFFGENCSLCGNKLGAFPHLCELCLFSIKPQPERDILEIPYLDGYKTFAPYKGVAEELVRLVKFEGVKKLLHPLGQMVKPSLEGYIREINPDEVTYIPTNPFRLWFSRGFDPVEELLKAMGIPHRGFIKRRWLLRKPLASSTSVEERKRLVKNAFKVDARYAGILKGKTVLVVDDLLTSGSTASEVAYLLKSVGVERVFLFALFRA